MSSEEISRGNGPEDARERLRNTVNNRELYGRRDDKAKPLDDDDDDLWEKYRRNLYQNPNTVVFNESGSFLLRSLIFEQNLKITRRRYTHSMIQPS